MFRSTGWSARLAVLGASVAIIVSACAGTTPSALPSTAATPAATTAAGSVAPYSGLAYPATAVDCKNRPAGYTGEFSQIKAVDRLTVEFDLCAPDVAFLQKIAFATNGIFDSDWLKAHAVSVKTSPDKSYVRTTNGTGPYMFKSWTSGDNLTLVANPNYWGDPKAQTPTLIFKWSGDAAKRLQDLQAGVADGIDNVGTEDVATVEGDSSLKLYKRDPFTVLYLGFNVADAPWDNEKVRQAIAMGIDKKRLNDLFNPAGSTTADFFTPSGVLGADVGTPFPAFDKAKAIDALKAANFDFSKTYDLYFRPKVRPYFPNPPAVAQDLQAQFKDLGIKITVHTEDNAKYLGNLATGKSYSMFLVGWTGDYPDQTDWVDYHFGTGANDSFGPKFQDIETLLTAAASELDQAKRLDDYKQANTLLAQHVPMIPLFHASSSLAFKADVTGVLASALSNEAFWPMKAADRPTLVFEQNSETSGLYCGDESDGDALRNCIQIYDSLYTFKIGGTDVQPNLATSCAPNPDGTVWTCTLRDNVKFADGAALDANDVVDTYAAQWDSKNPLHVGNAGSWEYFPGLFGGLLNPPPAAP